MDLTNLKDFFAVVGAVAVLLSPFLRAWVKQTVQNAVADAPALAALAERVHRNEQRLDRHDELMGEFRGLSQVMDRMERTLEKLDGTMRLFGERVAALEVVQS